MISMSEIYLQLTKLFIPTFFRFYNSNLNYHVTLLKKKQNCCVIVTERHLFSISLKQDIYDGFDVNLEKKSPSSVGNSFGFDRH